MLREWLENNDLTEIEFKKELFPKIEEREKWESLSDTIKTDRVLLAKRYRDYDFKPLSASDFIAFSKDGNMEKYEKSHFERREALVSLALGECIDDRGRFTENVINGIISTCEETFWGLPAFTDEEFYDKESPVIDAETAKTASTLAIISYILKEKLDEVSKAIIKRIKDEIRERIIEPFSFREDYWWMGYYTSEINSDNPEIISNLFLTFIYCEDDEIKQKKEIRKAMYVLDSFVSNYSQLASCDEGAEYWNKASLSLFEGLETLNNSTSGKINFLEDKKIIASLSFPLKTYIGKNYFVNFSSCSKTPKMSNATIFRVGKINGDKKLMALASNLERFKDENSTEKDNSLAREIGELFILDEFLDFNQGKTKFMPDFSYMDDIGVVTARKGNAFFAAKAGNNHETRNHNDVGNFIYYLDEEPIFIDLGEGSITKNLMSDERYSVMEAMSDYHNLPKINDASERNGIRTNAKEVRAKGGRNVRFSFDMKNAYDKCSAKTLERKYKFDGNLEITDTFTFKDEMNTIEEHFITPIRPQIIGNFIKIKDLRFYFDELFEVDVEEITLSNKKLINDWGKIVYRIVLTAVSSEKFETTFKIERQKIKK